MLDVARVQASLKSLGLDGWLLYDFRLLNPLAARIAETATGHRTRRYAYFIPTVGEPKKLVHKIEPGSLDHLAGSDKTVYLRWQEWEAGVKHLIGSAKTVAMEYSARNANPYIARVDAGTVELVQSFGAEVVSSGDLVQEYEATWTPEQVEMHFAAAKITETAYDVAWAFMAEEIRKNGYTTEMEVQAQILKHFADHGAITDHPPIVGVDAHAGDPHYSPSPETNSRI